MSNRGPLTDLNRVIRENRVRDFTSPNLALGMTPVEFGVGTSRWAWSAQPAVALNPFGTVQGGYLAIFVDEFRHPAAGRAKRLIGMPKQLIEFATCSRGNKNCHGNSR